jgi:hypothetical protein
MASYKTSEEAVLALSKELTAKQARLKQLEQTTDAALKKQAETVRNEIKVLERKISIEAMSMEGLFGKAKVAGIGLLVGVPRGVTSLIDLAAQGASALDKLLPDLPGKLKPREDFLLTPRVAPGVTSSSRESAPAFGLGEGAGMSAIGGPTQAAVGGVTRAADETFFEGTPVTQLTAAAYMISRAVASGVKNWQENRGVRKMLEQLGPDGDNKLRNFMIRGQDSTDPLIAGVVNRLRQNPSYADLFNVLEKQATKEATKGARVAVKPGYPVEATGQGIYQAVEGRLAQLKENIKVLPSGKFEAAKKMGGNNDILFTDNTVKQIDSLIDSFSKGRTDDSAAALNFLNRFRTDLAGKKISVEQMQASLSEFGAQAKKGESLISDLSLGSQEKIATSIFSGLKDDLVATGQQSTVPRIREISRLLDEARKDVKKGYDAYNNFVAQGLPAKLKDKPINAIDTEELLQTVKGLSNNQRDRMAAVLQNTAPEDLKRVRQVMYDDFVQSARTVLPDGSTGVDLKLLSNKFNTLPENERKAMAFAVGTSFDDFSGRMKDAENFFKYQQKFGGEAATGGFTASEIQEMSSAGYLAGGYGVGKTTGLVGRMYNSIKGGLSDENMLNLLMSPETKGLLRDAVTNPNSAKTVEKISRVLGGTEVVRPALMGASYIQRTEPEMQAPQPTPIEPWDIGPATGGGSITVQGAPAEFNNAPAQPMPTETKEPWDIGPATKLSPAEIETQIRSEADKQGLSQYADLFVRQAKQESSYNPYAVSKAGAQGVFQLMPGTAKELGVTDPFDVGQNISGGIRYMGQQLKRFNDPALALAAYNAGPSRVASAGGIPNIPETQDYVKKILGI